MQLLLVLCCLCACTLLQVTAEDVIGKTQSQCGGKRITTVKIIESCDDDDDDDDEPCPDPSPDPTSKPVTEVITNSPATAAPTSPATSPTTPTTAIPIPPEIFTLVIDDIITTFYADGNLIAGNVVARAVNVGTFSIPGYTKQVAIQGENRPGLCAFIGSGANGKFVTDAKWRCSNTAADGWSNPDFDDSAWELATAKNQQSVNGWLPIVLGDFTLLPSAQVIWTSVCVINQPIYCRSPKAA